MDTNPLYSIAVTSAATVKIDHDKPDGTICLCIRRLVAAHIAKAGLMGLSEYEVDCNTHGNGAPGQPTDAVVYVVTNPYIIGLLELAIAGYIAHISGESIYDDDGGEISDENILADSTTGEVQ